MIMVFFILPLDVVGGLSGIICMVTSASKVPSMVLSLACSGPGVPYLAMIAIICSGVGMAAAPALSAGLSSERTIVVETAVTNRMATTQRANCLTRMRGSLMWEVLLFPQ